LTSERKLAHLAICRDKDVTCKFKPTHFNDVELVHVAIPEMDLRDVDLSVKAFGKTLSVPLLISAMTGGHPEAKKINENLAIAAKDLGIGMCVGSQRAALEDPSLEDTFAIVRAVSKEILVVGNIGAPQLLLPKGSELAKRAVNMIDADALALHLNPLQELVQPGGDTNYKGVLKAIRELSRSLGVPVIVKETGCGISKEVAKELVDTGAYAIDVSGAGGTSWAAVEYYNAIMQGNNFNADVAESLWDWGIPTAMSICEVVSLPTPPRAIIASGGIRDGLDMAKAIALGADLVGIARPLLVPAFAGPEEVKALLQRMIYELKAISMLTGSKKLGDLKRAKFVIKGELLNWVVQRDIGVKNDAQRRNK
jgi:isopentenyl-diphosphate delta-isomerase